MQAAEKRKQEQEELKASRIDRILERTYDLFSNDGIDSITMDKIAENAEIGVASLYRYFSTKDMLAIECATYAWKKEEATYNQIFEPETYATLTGLAQLNELLSVFPKMFLTEGKFFRFIYYFDAYIKRQSVMPQQLTAYEATIIGPQRITMEAIKKGRADGSIHITNVTDEEIYFTATHALFSLAQKLSLSGEMLYMDKSISAQRQMELLVSMIINSLK
jgi:Transcriptional regulator